MVESFRITLVTSSALTAGQVLSAYLDEPMGQDFFVTDMRSTVNRPLAFAGSIFKAQSDVFNSQNPNIDCRLTVQGGNPGAQYVINGNFTPLELLAPPIAGATASPVMCNFTLRHMQTVKAEFVFNRALGEGENPTSVSIIFKGWRLGCSMYNGLSTQQARAALHEEYGI